MLRLDSCQGRLEVFVSGHYLHSSYFLIQLVLLAPCARWLPVVSSFEIRSQVTGATAEMSQHSFKMPAAQVLQPLANLLRAVLSIAGPTSPEVQSICATSAAFAAITGM